MSRNTAQYGQFYWCIGTAEKDKTRKPVEAYVMADRVEITPTGALVLWGKEGGINLAFAPGAWVFIYAASVLDGSAVAVDHWPGQITEAH